MLTSPPELFRRAQALKDEGASFVIATVIRVRGSASAKTGSKAIFDGHGTNLYGYVGGGCAQSHLAQEGLEALREKKPRIVEVDLDDEVYGLMPCGGIMDVYLEPHFPSPVLPLPRLGVWEATAIQLLGELGFQAVLVPNAQRTPASWREVFLQIAAVLATWRGEALEPLRGSREWGKDPLPPLAAAPSDLLIFGQTRITEEFSRISQWLGWPARIYCHAPQDAGPHHGMVCELPMQLEELIIPRGAWVVIASHHKQDAALAEQALRSGAEYVALVASDKRSRLIVQELKDHQLPAALLARFCIPAGLRLPTDTPLQIAFSIACEILWAQA